ncbi:MAG: Glu/Leu/Phe/Val dehydrogenase [Myxococcota bacterium]|nr:Glu/Leu/Phe/Val dehydrogenase [Myxococcota bacterium]
MDPFEQMASLGHEQVVFTRNDDVGLRAIIGIHDTTLGPALGGCRLYPYGSEAEALRDVLRLSRGMTYKAAVAGLDLGGGKAVIIGDPGIKSEGLFRAFGRAVESLGGRYITAEDMNTNVEDMNNIARETRWVSGRGHATAGGGDPSPVTAWGVYHGVRAAAEVTFGSPDMAGKKVAIQGCGNVGYWLAKYLHEEGAELIYSDINGDRVKRCLNEFGGRAVEGDEYYSLDVDVLAPCAIGGIINSTTIPMLRAPIIAGGANNVLNEEDEDGHALLERGIAYAPDYVINAGGLVSVYAELHALPHAKAMEDAAGIFNTVKSIMNAAKAQGTTTMKAANALAEARIETVARVKRMHIPG